MEFFKFFKVLEIMFCKGKWILLICQENIRELNSFHFVSNDEKQKTSTEAKGHIGYSI